MYHYMFCLWPLEQKAVKSTCVTVSMGIEKRLLSILWMWTPTIIFLSTISMTCNTWVCLPELPNTQFGLCLLRSKVSFCFFLFFCSSWITFWKIWSFDVWLLSKLLHLHKKKKLYSLGKQGLKSRGIVCSIFLMFLEVAVQPSTELHNAASPVYNPSWSRTTPKPTTRRAMFTPAWL